MAYELFDNKAARRFGSPQLRIRNGKIAFNADSGDCLTSVGAKFVHLLWDAREGKLAIRPAPKEDSRTFRVSISKGKRGGTLAIQSFLNYIQWNARGAVAVEARWNDAENILEARLPKEHLGAKRVRSPIVEWAGQVR